MEAFILDKAKDLFFSYGLKSVSMEDIARNAGVSKKTLYKDFEDKNQLIQHLVADLLAVHQDELEKCSKEAKDAIAEVIGYTRSPFDIIALINQSFFFDLEKLFPASWKQVTQHREQVLIPAIIRNLDKGIAEGVYRSDLDRSFIAEMRVQQILTALNPTSFTGRKLQRKNLMVQLSEFYLQGIATQKGKKLINKYLNLDNEKQFSN